MRAREWRPALLAEGTAWAQRTSFNRRRCSWRALNFYMLRARERRVQYRDRSQPCCLLGTGLPGIRIAPIAMMTIRGVWTVCELPKAARLRGDRRIQGQQRKAGEFAAVRMRPCQVGVACPTGMREPTVCALMRFSSFCPPPQQQQCQAEAFAVVHKYSTSMPLQRRVLYY